MRSDIPNVVDLIWRAAANFSGGLCYLVVRRDLPPRKAVGVIVIAIASACLPPIGSPKRPVFRA